MKKKFLVEGMTCASCQSHVENTVSNLKGVNEVNVSLLTNSMNVDYDDKLVSEEEIILSVSKIGYKASINKNKEKKTNKELVKLIVSFSLLLLLMYVAMGHMLSLPLPSFLNGVENSVYFALTQLVITIPIIIIYRRYYVSGIIKLIRRQALFAGPVFICCENVLLTIMVKSTIMQVVQKTIKEGGYEKL